MKLHLVLVLVLVALVLVVQDASADTLNKLWPDLLPQNCGRRFLDEFYRPRIVGGDDMNTTAYHGEFPWQAHLMVDKRGSYTHQCGGVIISRLHVLTAAHCVEDVGLRSLRVRAGDLRAGSDPDEQEFAVENIRIHGQFRVGSPLANDFAVLTLKPGPAGNGVKFGAFVRPACLPDTNTEYPPNTACEVSGWGRTSDGGPISDVLRGVEVPLVTDGFCSSLEVHQAHFHPGRTFCAGLVRGGPDSCQGDSGGPLVCRDTTTDRYTVLGLVSTGDPRGCGQLPGLYTKVSGFVDWLLPRLQLDLGGPGACCPCTAAAAPPEAPADVWSDCGRLTAADGSEITTVSSPGDLPWLVTLHPSDTDLIWPGVVVSDRWILAGYLPFWPGLSWSARSVPGEPDGDYTVITINRTVVSPQRDPYDRPYVTLFQTSAPIPVGSGLRPVCLPDQQQAAAAGQSLLVADTTYSSIAGGWRSTDKLEVFNATTISDADCRSEFSWLRREDPEAGMFCVRHSARGPDGECRGVGWPPVMAEQRSGGGRRWALVGRVIYGNTNCDAGIVTNAIVSLRQNIEWINSVISQN